jgi:hypothetical protein
MGEIEKNSHLIFFFGFSAREVVDGLVGKVGQRASVEDNLARDGEIGHRAQAAAERLHQHRLSGRRGTQHCRHALAKGKKKKEKRRGEEERQGKILLCWQMMSSLFQWPSHHQRVCG